MTELTKVEKLREELAKAIAEEEAREEREDKNKKMLELIDEAGTYHVTYSDPEDKRVPESLIFNEPGKTTTFKGDQLNILREILYSLHEG